MKFLLKTIVIICCFTASNVASASTISLFEPRSPFAGDELTFNLSHELAWDTDVQFNAALTDEFSHVQFSYLNISVDGAMVASLGRPIGHPSTYTTNPNGSYSGGRSASAWTWTYSQIFGAAGEYEVSFEGQGYFWRQLLPIPGRPGVGGFTGGMLFDMSGSTNVTVASVPEISAVPLPAGMLLLLSGFAGLGFLRLRNGFHSS